MKHTKKRLRSKSFFITVLSFVRVSGIGIYLRVSNVLILIVLKIQLANEISGNSGLSFLEDLAEIC